ncbi:MAG: hypothetical protein KDD70_19365, partial [Bdellovibrionales bacterium]|nr:hypothetical protein [Bdellovibrionales bacterium]
KEISPNCGAGSVELNMSSTDEESPVSSEEENGTFTCTVTIRANVLVRCAGGDTSITNPEASGENVAYVECKKPEAAACEQTVEPTQTQTGMFERTEPSRQSDINSSQY